MTQIPEQMTAVRLNAHSIDSLSVEKIPVPKPGPDEVLIKMAASPINPSDLGLISGSTDYISSNLPATPGVEGSGTVVQAPKGMMGRYLMGKRVACTRAGSSGTWAEYMVTKAQLALPLNNDVSLEQGAMSVVNPLTALAFLDIAKKGGHRTLINTAAASMLGQMLQRLAVQAGIQIVHIVRRQEHVELLQKIGASIVLNSTDEDFKQQLKDVCKKHQVRLALDAIIGPMTDILLGAIQPGGKVIIYSALSSEQPCVNFNHFVGPDKSIEGFLLTTWFSKRNFLQNLMLWRQAQKMMGGALQSEVRQRVSLEEAPQAVANYATNMSGGKILVVPETA